jgi:RNA polymerase sigma-70 factor (ECF subfamily)
MDPVRKARVFVPERILKREAVSNVTGTANETLLIEKARAKDLRAFSELVMLYQEKMLHVAYSFVGNREDARDLAQETFVKAYGALKDFKGDSRFSTWLYRILANTCKDFLRKKSVRWNLFAAPLEEEPDQPRAEDRIASTAADARDFIERQEMDTAIREALETLPVQQKTVFAMRYLEGLSLAEIAEAMNLSEGAVKAHLWQAGQKMQKRLVQYKYV